MTTGATEVFVMGNCCGVGRDVARWLPKNAGSTNSTSSSLHGEKKITEKQ